MWVIFWCLTLAALTYYFNDSLTKKYNPNQVVESTSSDRGKSIVLKQNKRGHYVANGFINGESVIFLLDTGATLISIPAHLGKKLGLSKGKTYPVSTANGSINVFATKIESLEIGTLRFNNIEGHLNPGMDGYTILLGMNALKHLELRQANNSLTLTIPNY
ncbi:TIGR02281 family clan AA aspartic protease [Psychrobium sp. nBUS_13]|uniref:retropepsin-like aspartic protease family protein n=1 Tax=Psychrobium sp. nBUS_13 TaxID=3395319 RepID=UPI003EBD73C1